MVKTFFKKASRETVFDSDLKKPVGFLPVETKEES